MGQLESHRDYAEARLWGMRVNFRPLRSLDVGLSRTAQWGGDGRPGDMDTFWNLFAGRDNRGDDNVSETGSNEPGNQLGGIDLRWSYSLGDISGGIYGQLIGEDEAGGTPSRHIGMAGVELQTTWIDTQLRVSLEGQNTTVYFYDSTKTAANAAYEHSIYHSGYRYYERPLGAASDNDTEAYVLRGQIYFSDGDHLSMSFATYNLNRDGTDKESPGGSVFRGSPIDIDKFSVSYVAPLNSRVLLDLGIFHHSDTLYYSGEKMNSGGFLGLRTYW